MLCAYPASSLRSWVLPARCSRPRRPTPSRLPASMALLILCFPFHSAGSDGIQPAAELRHVQRHKHAVHVPGALRACPALMQPPQLGPGCTLLAPPPPTALPPPGPACRPSSYASLSTRQRAGLFNQLLSWDTSSVTTMIRMFEVRPARALPAASTVGSSLHAACAAAAPRPPAFRPACRPSSYASLPTRQEASAFNQPMSYDTSSVKNMDYMLTVRSARALASTSTVRSSMRAARAAATLRCLPACMPPLFLCYPFDSAARGGVQPATELGHVQRHNHAADV